MENMGGKMPRQNGEISLTILVCKMRMNNNAKFDLGDLYHLKWIFIYFFKY